MRQRMDNLKYWLRALWNVFLGRPTMYRMIVIGDITLKNPDSTWLVTGCTFFNGGVKTDG